MKIDKIFAQVACTDLAVSSDWYARLLGRPHDVSPMNTLREWHHGTTAGLQLFANPHVAGKSTITIMVSDLDAERRSLVDASLKPGAIEHGDAVRIVRLNDPDGNLVVLAQPT